MSLPTVALADPSDAHIITVTALQATLDDSVATKPPVALEKAVFRVQGMTCASCVNVIETYVGDLVGVDSVVVALLQECATVRFDPAKITVNRPHLSLSNRRWINVLLLFFPARPGPRCH